MSLKNKGGHGETVIAEGVKVEGNFTSDGNVVIDGAVSGSVAASGDVTIGERAMIDADLSASNAVISGEVKGSVRIEERLELTASARVKGDIEARTILMAPGCRLNGKVTMPDGALAMEMSEHAPEPVEA